MTFGSLFAGIGGIDLGLERAGMECAWQVEIDPYCVKVLAKHWPEVPRYGDVRECGSANLVPVDLICGGFPCQPHSLAGKRQASGDERDLWGEFARIVCEVRPRWVLAENVPGLLSSESGRFFSRVLRDLAALGYDVEWESIPACALGAPHTRERVYIVAHSNGVRFPLEAGDGTEQHSIFHGAFPDRLAKAEWFADAVPDRTGTPEPELRGMADGIPSRVDRLRCLGNAVVPQVAELIGCCIIKADRTFVPSRLAVVD